MKKAIALLIGLFLMTSAAFSLPAKLDCLDLEVLDDATFADDVAISGTLDLDSAVTLDITASPITANHSVTINIQGVAYKLMLYK